MNSQDCTISIPKIVPFLNIFKHLKSPFNRAYKFYNKVEIVLIILIADSVESLESELLLVNEALSNAKNKNTIPNPRVK